MTYITAAQLSSAMGSTNYNYCLATDGSAIADTTLVADLLTRVDNIINRYNTRLSTTDLTSIAYQLAIYQAYFRRGPGTAPMTVQNEYESAMAMLKANTGIRVRPTYVPEDEVLQETLDDQVQGVS